MEFRKNIVIRSGSLRMGGLERVLIEVIQNLNIEKYNISLIIEDNCGEDNVFQKDIPEGIDLYFVKSQEVIKKTHYYREKRKNIIHKIIYNILMYKEHILAEKEVKNILKKIEKKWGEINVFIDYDWGARRYIDKLKVHKKIVWIHNSVPNMLKKNSKINRFGKYLEKYDVIIAICDEMKDELIEIYPNLKYKIKRIYNPFNFTRIKKLSGDRNNLTLEDEMLLKEKYILAVSRLDTNQKDYLTLLKGIALAKEKGMKEKLYIIGDGPSKDEIKNLIEDLKLQDSVKLLGQKKNPYIWMKNCKIFVHSSKYEGFGLVLVEAASLGKAIISSDCKVGPKEILGNGIYGKIFSVGDYNQLSEELIDILKDKIKIENYEKKSLERSKIFDVKKVISEYEELIDA